nr:MAG TPA: hypothetical protein [Bacteriophage sp.]DAE79081.1 MAG TPA: hypothetical protein [Caudoviricetes sp.]
MAIYRNVQLSFWTDNKILDDFTPEDKYFYLYLLTNPHTNICGCYEISYKSMSDDTGYNKETIIRLLERFDKVHGVIKFSPSTKEVLILNWYKYNWSKSSKVLTGACNVAKYIKNESFKKYIFDTIESVRNNTLNIPYEYPMETSVSDTDSDSVSDTVINNIDNNKEIYINIINYLNNKCNTRYRYNTPNTKKHIKARLNEGYTEQDFYTVISKKADEWLGTEQEKYLRPDTLFGTKFESYLNQQISKNTQSNKQSSQLDRILESLRGETI